MSRFSFEPAWPAFDLALLASAMRWTMLALIVAGLLWLMFALFPHPEAAAGKAGAQAPAASEK